MPTSTTNPAIGDVAHTERVTGERGDLFGIRVTLHGHPHRYVVAVTTGKGGPKLIDLHIEAAAGQSITPESLRAIPSRRLAHAAARWALEADGKIFTGPFLGPEADDMTTEQMDQAITEIRAEADARPEATTARGKRGPEHFRRVADLVRTASRSGFQVRPTVAEEFNVSLPTVDKWIRKCKDDGLLAEDEMRAPTPRSDDPSPSAHLDNSGSADVDNSPARPKRRRKADDYGMLERMGASLSGLASAATSEVSIDDLTPEQAAELLGGDLAASLQELNRLRELLAERAAR